jgi:hypothetical protein
MELHLSAHGTSVRGNGVQVALTRVTDEVHAPACSQASPASPTSHCKSDPPFRLNKSRSEYTTQQRLACRHESLLCHAVMLRCSALPAACPAHCGDPLLISSEEGGSRSSQTLAGLAPSGLLRGIVAPNRNEYLLDWTAVRCTISGSCGTNSLGSSKHG